MSVLTYGAGGTAAGFSVPALANFLAKGNVSAAPAPWSPPAPITRTAREATSEIKPYLEALGSGSSMKTMPVLGGVLGYLKDQARNFNPDPEGPMSKILAQAKTNADMPGASQFAKDRLATIQRGIDAPAEQLGAMGKYLSADRIKKLILRAKGVSSPTPDITPGSPDSFTHATTKSPSLLKMLQRGGRIASTTAKEEGALIKNLAKVLGSSQAARTGSQRFLGVGPGTLKGVAAGLALPFAGRTGEALADSSLFNRQIEKARGAMASEE